MTAAGGTRRRDLAPLFRPRAVAVIGASDDPTVIRGRILAQLVKGGHAGPLLPIHPTRRTIQGMPAHARIGDAPGPVDLALIAIPAAAVPDTLAECAAAGVRAAMVYSAGFAEEGGDSAALQQRLRDVARDTGMVVAGPNSVGFLNVSAGLAATFSPAIDFAALPGLRADPRPRIGIVSQSGGLGFALFNRGLKRRLPFGYVVNTGNEADLDATEMAEFLLDDPETGVILLFLESIRQGPRFMALAERALALGKPLVVTKIGRSAAGRRAAASHTASLTGSDAVYEAVFRRYGVLRADDMDEMLDIAAAAALLPPMAGRRVGVVTISGGVGGWLSDTLEAQGLSVPQFGTALQGRIREFLPSYGAAFNPVDITAQAISNDHRLRSIETLLDSDEIDAVVNVSSMANDPRLAQERDALAALAARRAKPVLFYSYPLPSDAAQDAMAGIGIPLYTSLRGAAAALGALATLGEARRLAADGNAAPTGPAPDRAAALRLLDAADRVLCEYEAKQLLAAYGIPVPAERLARDESEAAHAAHALGWPVALKIQSPDIPHKTECGGVVLGIADETRLREAFAGILARARDAHPDARIHGILVQPMAQPGLEMIAGVNRDPDFGPHLMVGLGGVLVEILGDVAIAPVPVGRARAQHLLDGLRGARLLGSVRGAPPRDRAALADLMVRLSDLAADLGDRIGEIDLNPVLVHETGLTIVDALIVQRTEEA